MRVCIVSDGLPPNCGGAPLRAFRHSQRLRNVHRIDSLLIAWDRYGHGNNSIRLPENIYPVRLRYQENVAGRSPIGFARLLLSLAELGLRLGSLLFSHRAEFDILHVINAASLFGLVTIPIAKLLGKPVILETVGLGGDDPLTLSRRRGDRDGQLFPHRPLKFTLFLLADAYVSKSPALSNSYREAGLHEVNLFQIPNGVDIEKYRSPSHQEKGDLRRKLGLSGDRINILFVGAINELKGVDILLEAFRDIVPFRQNASLLVVGPTLPQNVDYLRLLQTNIHDWGLSESVTIIDEMVDNISEYMQASDIFCLPTLREGFPGVVIEAMATGLPVVVSRLDGITTEIIRSGYDGILVSKGEKEELEASIDKLISDSKLRERIGVAARQKVELEFTDDRVENQYLWLYQHIHNQGRNNASASDGINLGAAQRVDLSDQHL